LYDFRLEREKARAAKKEEREAKKKEREVFIIIFLFFRYFENELKCLLTTCSKIYLF
jgi:hypothetical protein